MPSRHSGWWCLSRPRGTAVTVCLAALIGLSGCGGSPTPQPPPANPPGNPPADPPGTDPGAIQVRGTEKIAWDQLGNVSELRFVAYVDGQRTPLDLATCASSPSGPQGTVCLSPQPPLTVGVHIVELAAVSNVTQLESQRSVALRLQKLATIETGSSAVVVGSPTTGGRRALDDILTTDDGLVFDIRIVASGFDAPTQMAWAPDRRLFVAEASGSVQVLQTTEAEPTLALDARAVLDLAPAGGLGLALHPEFLANHLVYLAHVARDRRDQAVLRVVRLREVGGTLGEPAVIFEEGLPDEPPDGPRIAFGPDGRLYIGLTRGAALPGGAESGARGSNGAFMRIGDDGRVAGESAVFAYGPAQPIGFDWLPGTQALWAVLARDGDRATLGRIGTGRDFGNRAAAASIELGPTHTPGRLLFYRARAGARATAFVALPDSQGLLHVSAGEPARTEVLFPDALGRIGDVVLGEAGALYLSTRNRDGRGAVRDEDDLIVRLTPRKKLR